MTGRIISHVATFLARAIGVASLVASGTAAHCADYPALPLRAPESGWTVTFTPYAWLISLNGSQTVRGRTVDVDETFFDIVHDTIGKGGQLFAAMAQAEARHGPFSLFGDVVWEQFAIKGGGVVARSVRPGITAGLAATGELRGKMAIAEAGAAYEVARFGFPFGDVVRVPMALDVLAGARYWYQEADVSFDIRATVDIADLVVVGTQPRHREVRLGRLDRSLHWRAAALCGRAGPRGVRPRGRRRLRRRQQVLLAGHRGLPIRLRRLEWHHVLGPPRLSRALC